MNRAYVLMNVEFMAQAGLPRFIPRLINSEFFPSAEWIVSFFGNLQRDGDHARPGERIGFGIFPRNIYGERTLKYDPLYSLSVHTFSSYVYKGSSPIIFQKEYGMVFEK